MNIIFLGYIIDPKQLSNFPNASVAGNKMQYYLLKELSKIDGVDISVVSSEIHAMFPKERTLFVQKSKFDLFQNVEVFNVSYLNIPFIKQFILKRHVYSSVKKLLNVKNGRTIILSYNLYPTQGYTVRRISKSQSVPTIAILADMTLGGVNKAKNFIRKLYQIYEDKYTLETVSVCENYIVLNEFFVNKYAPKANYIVIDGGVDVAEHLKIQEKWDGKEKNILYTGALVDYSGISTLIEAFALLNNKAIYLDIYGDGPLKEVVIEASIRNKNIRFFGTLPNEDILKKQHSCWALINPRPINNDIAKVTFPSKIFEYLMSGRPVISTRLNGFQKEYDDLLFWSDDTSTGLADSINKIDNIDDNDLMLIAERAKNYLLKNKTWEMNAKKIYSMINEIAERGKYDK